MRRVAGGAVRRLEKTWEARLLRGCKRRGWRALKFESISGPGWPDRLVLGVKRGHTFFVETKRERESLRRLQEVRRKELRRRGFRVYVCAGPQAVDRALQREDVHAKL